MRALRWLRISSVILLATICLPSGSVAAQTLEPPRQRQGYWLQLGVHGLLAETWEKGEHLGTWRGNLLSVRLGQLLTSRFGLGILYSSGAVIGTAREGVRHVETFTGLAMEAQWNPWRNMGLHAAAGMQFVALQATEGPDKGTRGNWGTGYAMGISYDFFPLARKRSGGFCLTPMLLAQYSPGATVATATFLAGLQVGYWTGLGGNQLALQGAEAYQEK